MKNPAIIFASIPIILFLITLAGCAGSRGIPDSVSTQTTNGGYSAAVPATTSAPKPTFPPFTLTVPPSEQSADYISYSNDRMVVRTGNMQLVVSDVSASIDEVVTIAADLDGYVVSSQKWKEGERTIGNISIRVPAESYDEAMASFRNMAMDVINETTSSEDVTQEYVDLNSRLKNLEATEAQLLKIMESAAETEDVLSIQRELTIVRGDIEQTKGRMQYLERTSATSLIIIRLTEAQIIVKVNANKASVKPGENISFTGDVNGGFAPYNYEWDFGDGDISNVKSPSHSYKEAGNYTVSLKVTDDKGYSNSETRTEYINVVGGWAAGTTAASAWNGLMSFGRVLVDILLWLAIFSPIWIIIGGIIWWNASRRRKRRATDALTAKGNSGNI